MASDPTLRRWYLAFNDKWFGGKLPFDLDVFWEPARGNLGETVEVIVPDGEAKELAIRIDPTLRFSNRMAKATLLHECVHVEAYYQRGRAGFHHGKAFKARMRELAAAGGFDELW